MTANPLMRIDRPIGGGVEYLEMHVARLNNYNWIRDSGKPFFIAKRARADGTDEHYVERHI